MDCPNIKQNMRQCNCSYAGCSKKGRCCECLHYHRRMGELPACFFPDNVEKSYDRSIANFMRVQDEK